MCANLARLEDDLKALEAAGIDELHFDIMDGDFVPNYTLGFDLIRAARESCAIPCHAHLMIDRPERYVQRFKEAGCDAISVHVEASTHVHRTLQQIRASGASPGIAINPGTPLTALKYLLSEVDRVLVMTVDPGYAGQKIIPNAFERVRILHENLRYYEHRAFIEVDGNIDASHGAKLARLGAGSLVLGTSAIFTPGARDLAAALHAFKVDVERAKHLV
jgi:ribulose-phosphate 3-epimerase